MKHHYRDITDRIPEAPKWWDEEGVPRYSEFGPSEGADIYAEEICLLEIACQDCGTRFKVAMSNHGYAWGSNGFEVTTGALAKAVRTDAIHYGDPPNADCCPAGPTMNSVPLRVLEFWKRGINPERIPSLEREIDCGWAA